ncbi:MAG: heme exporter protein CcmB [Thermoanaerobaculia bacterium]
MRFLRSSAAVFSREVRRELRRRSSITAVLFFAGASLVLISFSLASVALPEADRGKLYSGVLWVLLFFSAASGLPRSFVREEESGTGLALRKAVAAEPVLAGKFLFNYLLFLAIAALAAPLYSLLEDWTPRHPGAFTAVLLLAGFGLSFVSTFLSAIVSRAGQRDLLFVLTALPLVLPLLLPSVAACAAAASADSLTELAPYWRVLVSYDGLATIAGFLLIRFVWEG